MSHIYHITTRAAALDAGRSGEYRTESLASQGFIHFSQIFQTLNVANSFYAGQSDLVILVVDVSRLKVELKFEAPVHPGASASAAPPTAGESALFPHLYGPLNFDAVDRVVDFPAGSNGRFELPALD